jgi:hypothetical protein
VSLNSSIQIAPFAIFRWALWLMTGLPGAGGTWTACLLFDVEIKVSSM